MSQENVELIRACYQAANRRDFEQIAAALAADFAYYSPTTGGTYVGRNALREYMREIDEVISEYELRVEQLIDARDHVVASIRLTGIGRASNTPAEQPAAVAWTFRGAELIHGRGYATLDEALEAVGLRE